MSSASRPSSTDGWSTGPISRRRFLGRAAATGVSMSAAAVPLHVLAAGGTPVSQPAEAVVQGAPSQTMHGIGASGAWWPNDLVNFDPDVREHVAEMLFAPGPSGIGLSVYRYNIGGGGTGVANPVRAPDTFLVQPGEYDWGRDPGGRLFLQLASRHGVPVLIGFVDSAPAIWTTNGQCFGGYLKPGAEQDYARYLADIVEHFGSEGIQLDYVSPMNEPDYVFANSQEGMGVPMDQRATVVKALARELEQRGLGARVMADESSHVETQLLPEAPRWLGIDDVASHVGVLAHHLYDYPKPPVLQAADQLGKRFDLPTWTTEFCCIHTQTNTWGQQYDPTIANGIVMANWIWSVLTQANDAGVIWWVALSSALGVDPVAHPQAVSQVNASGWNDGLLYYDPNYAKNGNQRVYASKRYHVLGNFSRYVRPGAVRHDVSGASDPVRALAFRADGRWTAIVINGAAAGSPPAHLRMRFPIAGGKSLAAVEAVETSASSDLQPVPLPQVHDDLLETSLPAQSVTTFVLRE